MNKQTNSIPKTCKIDPPLHSLYKYKPDDTPNSSLDKRFTERIITHQELYFAKPNELNDPWETGAIFSVQLTNTQIKEAYRVWHDHSGYSQKQRKRFIRENVIKGYPMQSCEVFKGILKQLVHEFLKKQTGVCSVTALENDSQMWKEYAEGHKGLCFEFKWCPSMIAENELIHIQAVDYVKNLQTQINSDLYNIRDIAFLLIFRKLQDYTYEKEWRIIRNIPGVFKYPKEFLKSVIFGCRMTEARKEHYHSLIRLNLGNIPVCQSIMNESTSVLSIATYP